MLSANAILPALLSYLTVHNSHNGDSIRIPKPIRFHTLPHFKEYLLESFTQYIAGDVENLFLLTSFGIKLNFNMIDELSDVYVFDKRLFSLDFEKSILKSYLGQNESDLQILIPKDSLISQVSPHNNIKKMTSNLKINEGWSKAILQNCFSIDEQIKSIIKQINTIFKSLNIIFQFGANFVSGVEKNFNHYFSYIKLLSMKTLHKSWQEYYKTLKSFPKFSFKSGEQITLHEYLGYEILQEKSDFIKNTLPLVVNKFNEMSGSINNINDDKIDIDSKIENLRNDSILIFKDYEVSNALIINETIELSKDISKDLENLQTSNLNSLTDIYNDHGKFKSPKLFKNASYLYDFLQKSYEFKLKLVHQCLSIFQTIANLQMRVVNIKSDIKLLTAPTSNSDNQVSYETINKIKSAEDYLSLTIDLPLLFGFIIIENRRQFEWSDFYSKGIVNTISEQLSIIIDHEKQFQKLWLKKFNNFINFITANNSEILLPTIDVTLLNNRKSNLLGFELEREDILNYINLIKDYNSPSSTKFIEILEKNFKDLVKSTDNMQQVTKLVTSLSSYTSPNSNQLESSKVRIHDDVDLDVVKGLKNRIKKLENLLHQQQYKNISNWPVIKSQDKADNTKMSLIVDPNMKPKNQKSSSKNDPTLLLQRRHTSSSSPRLNGLQESKFLDASTTIDKHLDNIRLRKENSELLEHNNKLMKKKQSDDELIKDLRDEIFSIKTQDENYRNEINNTLLQKDAEISHLKESLDKLTRDKNNEIANLKEQLLDKDKTIRNLKPLSEDNKQIDELKSKVNNLTTELNDSNNMKIDLLSNMSAKESEFVQERNIFDNEIKSLKAKYDELQDDYENLMELTQAKEKHNQNIIDELDNVIVDLFKKIKVLVDNNFEFFLEFCFVLESMGLLLVKQIDETSNKNEFKIIRVKGLKSKKGNQNEEDSSIIQQETKIHSKILDEITSAKTWCDSITSEDLLNVDESAAVKSLSTTRSGVNETESDDDYNRSIEISQKLISTFNDFFTTTSNPFDEFIRIISFKDSVHLKSQEAVSEDDPVNHKFFLNAISKRFRDVEGFAKKLTKENKSKIMEMNKLLNKTNSKITINNFQKGDLVLFLPTRIERGSEFTQVKENEIQPWAAFNIGAPHYFLKMDQDISHREWMVGKVANIKESNVTHENLNDKEANPFQLSVGVTWFLIEAEETTN